MNRDKHKTVLVGILREIYSNVKLRNVLGFKGGTAAFLFCSLPRLSADLDFDLLQSAKKKTVLKEVKLILEGFGEVKEAREKKYTLFFLLSYGKGGSNVKVEISKRKTKASFKVRNYLGISMLVMEKKDAVAGKLSALITRKRFASRDLFDLWFFLKENWEVNGEVVKEKTGLGLKTALKKAVKIVEKTPRNYLLQGMGELLDENQKWMVKEKMKDDLIFMINLYLENISGEGK